MAQASLKPDRGDPRQRAKMVASYAVLILLTVVFLAPLLWMLVTSFKTNPDAANNPLSLIPNPITMDAW